VPSASEYRKKYGPVRSAGRRDYSQFVPEEVLEIIDGGRDYNGGKPPNSIRFGDQQVPNIRKADPAQTLLGAEQKAWFLERLRNSKTTWKIWGSTTSTLDMRADPQDLPPGMGLRRERLRR